MNVYGGDINDLVGKTIERVEMDGFGYWMVLHFTDETSVRVSGDTQCGDIHVEL